MLELFISLLALVAGPILVALVGRRQAPMSVLDAFAAVATLGLVAGHIVPEALSVAGPWASLALALGLLLPWLGHRVGGGCQHHTSPTVLWLGGLAIALHAVMDGIGLASANLEPSSQRLGEPLVLAIVLHRFVEGAGLWWLMRPLRGRWAALFAMGGSLVSTTAGYFLAATLAGGQSETTLAVMQLLVAGSLVHVLWHRVPRKLLISGGGTGRRRFALLGTLAAMACLVALSALES